MRKVALSAALGALLVVGCGQQQPVKRTTSTQPDPTIGKAHPQAVEPIAGAASPAGAGAAGSPGSVSVGPPSGGGALAQPTSDAQIKADLAASGLNPNPKQATLTPDGLAIPPIDAPPAVVEIINAGNQIARLPYHWGGGHGIYVDTGYDCSGSISFVFAAARLLNTTLTSGELINWGTAGPGKWITVFANNGHTFMYIAGLRFDTVALAQTGTRWSNRSATEPDKFAVRHPPGL
jgi:cell wall-associated NlpC family hydrolase